MLWVELLSLKKNYEFSVKRFLLKSPIQIQPYSSTLRENTYRIENILFTNESFNILPPIFNS